MAARSSNSVRHQVLATDLDGTLIPLVGDEQNRADLRTLARELKNNGITLGFVTGRHLASVLRAIQEFRLPLPDWIICDVGTSLFESSESGDFRPIGAYEEHLQERISAMPLGALRELVEPIRGLRLQEPEKQGRFKLSFYTDAAELEQLVRLLKIELERSVAPYSVIQSVDPFTGQGLIDLVPAEVSKAHALQWWCAETGLSRDAIVFAGDSGNDLAALTAGYRAIVVANAAPNVVRRAADEHRAAGWEARLFLARGKATSGVLEGCRWFRLFGHGHTSGEA